MLGSRERLPQTCLTSKRSRAYIYVLRHNTAFPEGRENRPGTPGVPAHTFKEIIQGDQNA